MPAPNSLLQSDLLKLRSWRNFFWLRILVKLRPIRLFIHRVLLWIDRKKSPQNIEQDTVTFSKSFESGADKFQQNGWVFLEDLFPPETYQEFLKQWPPFFHLHPAKHVEKGYDRGLINPKQTFQRAPIYQELQNFLDSDEFHARFREFAGDQAGGVEIKAQSISWATGRTGSYLIRHIDKVPDNPRLRWTNFLIFIDGSGGRGSGGTCIYQPDGSLMFEPLNLKNSCLVYRADTMLHGFPPMRRGTYRKRIGFQVISSRRSGDMVG